MSVFEEVRDLVEGWPSGGLVVAVLPDPTDPSESRRRLLEMVEAAGKDRRPVVVLDLAPNATDLADRFGDPGGPGFAQVTGGEVELEEVVREDEHLPVRYVPRGSGSSDADLVGSWTLWRLAERVRDDGGLLVVVLSRGEARRASPGWVDGIVLLGREDADDVRFPTGVPVLGHIGSGDESPGEMDSEVDSDRPLPTPPGESGEEGTGLFGRLPPGLGRRTAAGATVALLAAGGVAAWAMLGGEEEPRAGRAGYTTAQVAGSTAVGVEERPPGPLADAATDTPRPSPDAPTAVASSSSDTAAGRSGRPAPERSSAPDVPPRSREQQEVEPRTGRSPDPAGANAGGAATSDPADASLRSVADTLAGSVQRYFRQEERFRRGSIECAALRSARERAGDLFVQLSLQRLSLGPPLDPASAALYRESVEDIERVERAYAETGCPPTDGS